MPFLHQRLSMIGALVASLGLGHIAVAQTDFTWLGGDGNYSTGSNWDLGFPPTGEFDERAVINTGTARVSNTVIEPAEVMIADAADTAASLIIENGGTLSIYDDPVFAPTLLSSLGVEVGLDGAGTLVVQPGGTLSAANIIVRGSGSSVTFDGSGVNPANVSIGTTVAGKSSGTNVFGGTSFRVIGPNVNYTTANFDVEPGSVFIPEITGATHSTITAPDGVVTDGLLRVDLNGYSPTLSDTWNLFDTTSVSGSFSSIEATGDLLPVGQKFTFSTVPNGSLGVYGQLGIEQQLVLKVNRDTGAMSIETGTDAVSLDGYVIRSALNGINPSKWNSLQDQGLSDWRESPSPGSQSAIAELKPTASTAVTSGSPLQLGNAFNKPLATVFGTQELEDIEFEYFMPDGSTVQGEVIYEGDKQFNNLVLVVDPVDGDAILQNQSNLSVSIDGYTIHSESGSLLPNNGDWLSLEDQGAVDWRQSNPTVNDLTELLANGTAFLGAETTTNLGDLFRTVASGGTQDLAFQYLLPGDTEFTDGVVVYRDVNFQQVSGDFDYDGDVDLADLMRWQRDFGDTVLVAGTNADGNGDGTVNDLDLAVWESGFTGSPVGSLQAVPEPQTVALCLMLCAGLCPQRFRA